MLLIAEKKQTFCRITAKGIFVSGRPRPDILLTVSVLIGQVCEATDDDGEKLKRLIKYLNGTSDLFLTLRYNGMCLVR